MNDLYIISPNEEIGSTLENMIKYSTKGIEVKHIDKVSKDTNFKNKKLLFVAKASNIGYDIPIIDFLWTLYKRIQMPLRAQLVLFLSAALMRKVLKGWLKI